MDGQTDRDGRMDGQMHILNREKTKHLPLTHGLACGLLVLVLGAVEGFISSKPELATSFQAGAGQGR